MYKLEYEYEIWEFEQEALGLFYVPMQIPIRVYKNGQRIRALKAGWWYGIAESPHYIYHSKYDWYETDVAENFGNHSWIANRPRLSKKEAEEYVENYLAQEKLRYQKENARFVKVVKDES